jgi:hypothetical protein
MNFETITNIQQSKRIDIIAILSSATSIELCRRRQHIPFFFQEGRIPYETWIDIEQQYYCNMNVSTHTTQDFFLDYQGLSYEPVVNPCFEVFIEKENSSSLEESEDLLIERIKSLVENGRISEAQNMLSAVTPGISCRLDYWRRALTKPRVRLGETATGGNIKDDCSWLQKHSIRYKGQWVALKQGVLLGSHVSRVELHRSLKQSGKLVGATFFLIDSDE